MGNVAAILIVGSIFGFRWSRRTRPKPLEGKRWKRGRPPQGVSLPIPQNPIHKMPLSEEEMSVGKLEKHFCVLVYAVLMTVLGTPFNVAEGAGQGAGATASERLQSEGPEMPPAPGGLDDTNLEGLIAYSSVVTSEGDVEAVGHRHMRGMAGSPRSPEPSTLIMMGLGLLGLAGIGKKITRTKDRRPQVSARSARH